MPEQGVCPRQELLGMIETGIVHIPAFRQELAQPCSVDLPLDEATTCIRASFLPKEEEDIPATIAHLKNHAFFLDEKRPSILVPPQIYVNHLGLTANLPHGFRGEINAKSSTGRGDLMCRVFVDGEPRFDAVGQGGPRQCYLEMIPLSGSTLVRKGTALAQLRIGFGKTAVDEPELRLAYAKTPLLHDYDGKPVSQERVRFRNGGIEMTADLTSDIVGYRKRRNSALDYDLSAPAGSLAARTDDFWEKIPRPRSGDLFLEPGEFYLLSTKEGVRFPSLLCGALEPYDVSAGEIRAHYAGFFDRGFGFGVEGELPAAHATLEVRAHHTPFRITDGQPICVMRFHRMRSEPVDGQGAPAAYGTGIFASSSNYRTQRGPTLPKQFLKKG